MNKEYERGESEIKNCEHLWRYLRAETETYNKSIKDRTIIAERFYGHVFAGGTNDSGLTTSAAQKSKKAFCKDHWLSPRRVCMAMFEKAIWILDDYEEFKRIFRLSMSTIRMTSQENTAQKYKRDDEGEVVLSERLVDAYSEFRFMSRIDNEESDWHKGSYIKTKGFPLAHLIPEWYTEWESEHLE